MIYTRERRKINYISKRGKLMKFLSYYILITILFTSITFNSIALEESNSIPLKDSMDKSISTDSSTTDGLDDSSNPDDSQSKSEETDDVAESTSNDESFDKPAANDDNSKEEVDDISSEVNISDDDEYIDSAIDWLNENYDDTSFDSSNDMTNIETVKTEIKIEKDIGNISIGEKVIVESEKSEEVSIDNLEFIPSMDLKKVKFTIEKLEDIPEEITEEPILNGSIYVYLDIKLTSNDVYLHEEEIESLKFQFKVNKSWVYENNIDINSIKLFRYNSQWQPLVTIFIDEDDVYFFFEAESPGFSIYTVVGTEIVEGSPDIILNKPFIPLNGWLAIIGIVLIMLVAIVYKLKFIYKEE
jgi:PGF-pre-PGF domain-containing protein